MTDPLRAVLEHVPLVLHAQRAAAHAVARLEHHHVRASAGEKIGGPQARKTCAHHDDVSATHGEAVCYIPRMRAELACFVFALGSASLALGCNQTPTPHKDAPPTESAAAAAKADDVMDECPGKAAGHECSETPPADANKTHFGQAFELDKREGLSAAAARLGDAEEVVQVTGVVEAVCKKKGCWMELRDGDASAKVFTYAGEFFLPVDTAKGRKAVVEGTLKVKTMTQKFAKHLAEDQGEDPSKVKGPVKKLVIDAKSISLL